ENRRQTDDARRVSGAVAAVDVVGPDDRARELLSDEVHLVRGLRAGEHPERARSALLDRRPESRRGPIERLVPRGDPKDATCPDGRLVERVVALLHAARTSLSM